MIYLRVEPTWNTIQSTKWNKVKVTQLLFHGVCTGPSTTNPAKVAAVFWCLNECNSKFLSIFQLSTKDNFRWCILIQLNISCLFTILELKIAWDLLLLTKKLWYLSIVYDMNQFSKLNHHWNMIVKGRQL